MVRFSKTFLCGVAAVLSQAALGAPDVAETVKSGVNSTDYPPPPGCQDLNSGYAMKSGDVTTWPCVKVSRNAGTDNHIPRWPNLLGKTLKVTVNLAAVGCRWNLAFQAVDSLANGGSYCDGNCQPSGRCALNCVELDFFEANEHVWGTNIHAGNGQGGWNNGYAQGYGGDRSGMWNYGVNGGNVNTKVPIDVNIGFPVDGNGQLKALYIGLYQDGDTHPKATMSLNDGGGMGQATDAIRRGLLPGFSLWHVGATNWFDGPNCNYDYPSGDAYFYNWQLVDGAEGSEMIV